jgi:AsmA-like C-terminal region
MSDTRDPTHRSSNKRGPKLRWLGVALLIFLVSAVVAVRIVVARAEPIVRQRVIDALSNHFQSKVELDSFYVSVAHDIEVYGGGLKIFGATDPNPYEPGTQPLIAIKEFRFGSGIYSLFRTPMHIETVYVKGLELNIPPKGERQEVTKMQKHTPKMKIVVDKFVCEDTKLVINTKNGQKPPLVMPVGNLTMKDIGSGEPMQFSATLINPKPVGNIESNGLFGPFQPATPGDTPVQGQYSFRDADLSTIKGLAGTLSSTGEYSGTLGNIVVHGQTDTPDFQIATGNHPVALHTEFHATVDGTSGNTYLHPVKATFLSSSLTANGSVARASTGYGHDIELDVVIDHARIEDLLKLAVKTNPPVMTGPVEMQTKLNIPTGQGSVTDRLELDGSFHVQPAHFSNEKVQSKLDWLSLVSQGKPKQAREHDGQDVLVDLRGVFKLNDGLLSFSLLHFLIPGTHVDMSGDYALDGRTFDFRGKARLNATVSQMTTGWKSVLLKPVDPLFRKDGAGTVIPIKVTGTQGEPHFGLDLGHKAE